MRRTSPGTSRQPLPREKLAMLSSAPRNMPTTTTPKPDSRPATTATEKAFSTSADAMVGPTVVIGETRMPARAAATPESAYESITVCVAEMPISSPASASAETASNALPRSVWRLKTSIRPITAKTPIATDSSTGVTSTPSTWRRSCEIGVGKGRSSRPHTFSATE